MLNTNCKYLRDAARQENTHLLIKLAMRKMGFSGINSPRPTLRKKIVTGIALACQKSKEDQVRRPAGRDSLVPVNIIWAKKK